MFLEIVRFASTSIFALVVSALLFLVLMPSSRQRAYLSMKGVRRFVEYFGNISLEDDVDKS
jgi:hypothetical protein